mmetsp:Transcript_79/g.224  ORF Transcript_79/g.224 Transcript_79/m.224 type:complete len:107 (-) Transcript_79:224-544(-)
MSCEYSVNFGESSELVGQLVSALERGRALLLILAFHFEQINGPYSRQGWGTKPDKRCWCGLRRLPRRKVAEDPLLRCTPRSSRILGDPASESWNPGEGTSSAALER